MRRDRDEVQLHLVEPHHLLMHARFLDCERRALGDELEQLDVILRELVRAQRAHVHHADDMVIRHQRHAEHRLDPLVEKDGIEHVVVVYDGKDHGASRCGDPPGETAADGDAHALLDLFLDADRRARDKLVRRRVEQEDGARVDVEDVLGSAEQRQQQVLELEVRECDVCDRLNRLDPHARFALRLERGPEHIDLGRRPALGRHPAPKSRISRMRARQARRSPIPALLRESPAFKRERACSPSRGR